ncbi:MAG: glycosyltransferase family 2 protein [Paludibacter sp.]|nr:glycosyltransferase family 2 protein [Paludibacter sp.]
MKKNFVVIVTYNGQQWYEHCFNSFRASQIPVNVVVVDNSPNNETVDFIAENYPEIHLIKPSENLMFGRGNNLGIKYALENGADYVFLLNQDAWLIEQNTVNELVRIAEENSQYGIISPIHLNKEQNCIEKLLLRRFFDYKTTDKEIFNDLYFNNLKDIYQTKYVNAAAWFIPRKTLETVGGFDPIFYHYGEDDNYINRLFYNDLKLGICPHLRIVHDNDRPRPLYDSRENEVLWLIEFTDINKEINIDKEIRNARKKLITNTLKNNKTRAKYWNDLLIFLKTNKNQIIESRKIYKNNEKSKFLF